jgi:hypothetical protein
VRDCQIFHYCVLGGIVAVWYQKKGLENKSVQSRGRGRVLDVESQIKETVVKRLFPSRRLKPAVGGACACVCVCVV